MAFRIIDVLKLGKIEYIEKLQSKEDTQNAINLIRECKYKKDIVYACESDFANHPFFWMDIIYDMDDYFLKSLKMREEYHYLFTLEQYLNILYNTKYGEDYIYHHFMEVLVIDEKFVNMLFKYVIEKSTRKEFWLDFLLRNENLHVRSMAINIVIEEYPELLKYLGDDKYFTNFIGNANSQISLFLEKMASKDVSLIAYNLFNKGYSELFKQVKEYLFSNYDKNYLAYYLFEGSCVPFKNKQKEEINKDMERYFLTDVKLQFSIYRHYKDKLKQSLVNDFENRLRIINQIDDKCVNRFDMAYFYELGQKLELYIEKYLDLSKDKIVEKIGEGSTCYALRIGDFVLKFCDTKWSYEDVICPNLYLIIKNLEEDYIRDDRGIVKFGIEVQPYLKRNVKGVPPKYLEYFKSSLNELGYFLNDRLVSERWGDNVRLLDSYKDADTKDFKTLPEWFKEVPIVLVDRDRVYPTNRILETSYGRILHIKQISEGY